jgi:hypothetical protein
VRQVRKGAALEEKASGAIANEEEVQLDVFRRAPG